MDESNELDVFSDLEYEGDNSLWKLIAKKISEEGGYLDTTYAMEVPGGVLVRTSTTRDTGSSEALCFIPSARLEKNENENWTIK